MSNGRRDRVVPTRVPGSAAQQSAGGQPAAPHGAERSTAVTAYALQVGVNRQAGGRTGLIHRW